jgi:hypothetical protein
MGLRGEFFSTRVILQNRTYFFNVKENRVGDLYLNIVESKNRETGGFDRQSVILFADDLQEFLKGFDESLRVLEKEMRERRRSSQTITRDKKNPAQGENDERPERKGRDDRKAYPKGSRPQKPRKDHSSETGKRIVVKKR